MKKAAGNFGIDRLKALSCAGDSAGPCCTGSDFSNGLESDSKATVVNNTRIKVASMRCVR